MELVAEGVFLFDNDDEGYYKWLDENPDGFVVNTFKNPTPGYLKTHKATCPTIRRLQPGYSSFTAGYSKYCSNDIEKLREWALAEVQGNLQLCLKCLT